MIDRFTGMVVAMLLCAGGQASIAVSDEAPSLSPMPPDAPGSDEMKMTEIAHDTQAIACATFAASLAKGTGQTITRVVVTKNAKWGTIWRADMAFPSVDGDPPTVFRMVCTKVASLVRPLEMFDPSASIPPLKPDN